MEGSDNNNCNNNRGVHQCTKCLSLFIHKIMGQIQSAFSEANNAFGNTVFVIYKCLVSNKRRYQTTLLQINDGMLVSGYIVARDVPPKYRPFYKKPGSRPTMVATRVGTNSTISVFFHPLPPPPPHTIFIYFEIWAESLGTGVRFVLTNVLSSKLNIVPGGRGLSFSSTG